MKTAGQPFFALVFGLLLTGTGSAYAQSSPGLYGGTPDTDIARAWLDLLFRGTKLPETIAYDAAGFNAVAEAMHKALAVYSTGILVLAALLLFYNIAVMVAQTAHYGIPLGRRNSQLWAPIRLVLAIAFLVPVSGSLNAGQYLVAWMAEQGSALASHVWEIAGEEMKSSFSGIALPQGPNVSRFVAGGLEMEMCRALFHKTYENFQNSQPVKLAGTIDTIEKLPRTRFAEETWQYTNRLYATVPLCGAYRFASAHTAQEGGILLGVLDRLNNTLVDFSRSQTEQLINEAQMLAQSNLPIFLGETAGPGVHDGVTMLIGAHQKDADDRMHGLIADDTGVIEQTLSASAHSGWITAGGFMLQLARLQDMYGTMAAHALPAVQSPVFGQSAFLPVPLEQAIASDPVLWAYTPEETSALRTFYAQMTRTMRLLRQWLYDRQLADLPMILANPFDLREQLNTANDPEAISSLFGGVLNSAAVSYGVWNGETAPTFADKPLLALPSATQNVITALAEYGRRQAALGNYLFGIAGPDIAPSGTLTYAIVLAVVGVLFMASGFALLFLIPLLPFFRFFIGILVWLLNVFEAIIAVPIVALAHLNLRGEGLSGGAARQAYLLWLNIIIRPTLTLFGFIVGLLLFTLAIIFLGMVFYQLARLAPMGNAGMFVTVNIVLTLLYTLLAVGAANVSFRGVSFLPEMAFKWLGSFALPESAETSIAMNPQATATVSLNAPMTNLLTTGGAASPTSGATVQGGWPARAQNLKLALFPNYQDDRKQDPQIQKELERMERQESAMRSTDSYRESNTQATQNLGVTLQKAEKKKIDAVKNQGKKADVEKKGKTPRDEEEQIKEEAETKEEPPKSPDETDPA